MLSFLRRRRHWPTVTTDVLRKRGRILVIDDDPFDYVQLFRADGYVIEQWNDIENLAALERGTFDILILDIEGVGHALSADEGLGVLKHVRRANPAQLIIACSGKSFSLKHKEFFDLADVSLEKSTDYVDFKRTIDELLVKRFSIGFYVERIREIARTSIPDGAKLRAAAEKAILARDVSSLETYLRRVSVDGETKEAMRRIANSAISLSEAHRER